MTKILCKLFQKMYSLILKIFNQFNFYHSENIKIDRLLPELLKYSHNLSSEKKFQLAEQLSTSVYPEYKFSEYGRIWLQDSEFMNVYMKYMDTDNWHSYDRKYFLNQMLVLVTELHGSLAECGCYKGASAYILCNFATNHCKKVYLFDSFEGLSNPNIDDGNYWNKGDMSSGEETLHKNLREFNCFSIKRGWIPDCFSKISNNMFCFVHIDVDLYQPTLDSITYFYQRMVTSGILLFDDYGFETCPGVKKAVDLFFADKPNRIVMVPTGQAFVIC